MAQPVILCSAAIGFVLPAHAPRGLIMTRPTAPLRVPKLAAYDPALEQAVDAAVEAALEKAAAVATSSSASFWQLAFVFVCGGLFFSAVAAAVGAVYAVGLDNARRGFRLFGLLWRRVWAVMAAALRAAKSEVLNNDTTRWKEVWALLGQGFGEAKRAAAEGVEAIRAEAGLYAFALGAPGLLTLQYVVDRLAPFTLAAALEKSLAETLKAAKSPQARKLTLKSFDMGRAAPRMLAARAYDVGPDAMAFDVDMRWDSEMAAGIEVVTKNLGARVPVTVRNVRFEGTVRAVLSPLMAGGPGYGAMLLSLPAPPTVGMDLRVVGGEITKIPWLRTELEEQLLAAIDEVMLWPRRIVVPAEAAGKVLLGKEQLEALEHDDPLLRAERALAEQPALQESGGGSLETPSPGRSALDIFFGEGARSEAAAAVEGTDAASEGARRAWTAPITAVWRRLADRFSPATG
eukprot:Transcript_19903.p1 GENE.Transcript_19903~~Transcript_19903.p1  ORF type:complete len:460 (+),score=172.50 Transcript_19903:1437-2816(+)